MQVWNEIERENYPPAGNNASVVVGNAGSSESSAKTVLAHNMQGDAAKSELFKTFTQVIRSFQIQCHCLFSLRK